MIDTRVKKSLKRAKDIAEDLKISTANQIVEDLAKSLKKDLKEASCDDHPNHVSIVEIESTPFNKTGLFQVNKRNFCCKEFEQSIRINIKR